MIISEKKVESTSAEKKLKKKKNSQATEMVSVYPVALSHYFCRH